MTIDDVIRAYEEQCAAVEKLGGRIILMASRALVKAARSPDDYAKVYGRILGQVKEPVIIHWLGEMFDPALAGYWGYADHDAAMEVALDVIADNAAKVDGVKISLLDKDKEIAMRRRLPQGVRMYTGDDFNYAELIAGDDKGYSDALLGIFDAIAPAASAALGALTPRRRERSTKFSRRRCRCRATSSRRRPASTRPASCSWPISTACRIISPWSAARRARARPCISPSCSGSPTRPGCSPIPTWRRRACASSWRRAGSRPDARPSKDRSLLAINSATVKPWTLEQLVEGCVRAGITAIAPWRDIVQAHGVERAGKPDPRSRPDRDRPLPWRHVPAADEAGRRAALDDNRRAVDEAAAIGAQCLVLVVGGLPKGSRDLAGARSRCATASPRCCPTRAQPACRSRSSRCTRCTPPTAPA